MKKLLAVGVIILFLGLAIAPSINANVEKISSEPVPDLHCIGTLNFSNPRPGETYNCYFVVQNIGEPDSLLDWEVSSWPVWGNWTFEPSSWNDLTPEEGQITVEVTVIWPEEINDSGEIKLVNIGFPEDTCIIDILITPKNNQEYIDNELVEFTTEICGIDGVKPHTVSLSKEDAEEVEALFDSIRERLNVTETREEAEEIFKEAVVELDKYGLLGRLNVKQAQRLVTDEYKNINILKNSEKASNNHQNISKRNYFCLVAGQTIHTLCVHRSNIWLLSAIGMLLTFLAGSGMGLLTILSGILPQDLMQEIALIGFYLWLGCMVASLMIWMTLMQITHWNPISLFNIFGIGVYTELGDDLYYSEGWVNSYGVMGMQKWEGELLGNLPGKKIIYSPFPQIYLYPAIWGFNGIKISFDKDGSEKFYMGSAIAVGLDIKS